MTLHSCNASLFLCSKVSKQILREHFIFGKIMKKEKTFGTCEFQLKEGFMSFSRLTETDGNFKMLITNGEVLKDKRNLRGSWAWIKVGDFDKLYRTIIEEGFIHHASSVFGNITKEVGIFCKFIGIKPVIK